MRALLIYGDESRRGPYDRALEATGLDFVSVKPSDDLSLDGFHGLLLTGGTDVDPSLYGQERHVETNPPDTNRDRVENRLLTESLGRDLPVFAICRGMQMLNVHLGGSLIQDLPNRSVHENRRQSPELPTHDIEIDPHTKLHSIVGAASASVNSRHHQAIDTLGKNLVVTARCTDDTVIEAVELPSHRYVVGVEWHPEDQAPFDDRQRRLFDSFAQAVLGKAV